MLDQEIQDSNDYAENDRYHCNHGGLLHKIILGRPDNLTEFSFDTFPPGSCPGDFFFRHNYFPQNESVRCLLCFLVCCVSLAERAILFNFHTLRMVFLVFRQVVVTMFAFRACQCDSCTHNFHLALFLKCRRKQPLITVFRIRKKTILSDPLPYARKVYHST